MNEKKKLSNGAIYRRTFIFSLKKLLICAIALLILIASAVIGFYVSGQNILGLGIGTVIGIIIFYLLVHFVVFMLSAGQIAMMTKGVTEDALPDNVYQAGKAEVKANFVTVAAYYAVTNIISGIFNEITRGINALSGAGGAAGGVADTINGIIQVVIGYLENCCLGWVFYKKGQNAFASTCEGAVLFFKNWKALIRNLGRIFGFGLLSLIVIGGAIGVGAYKILGLFPTFISQVSVSLQSAFPDQDFSDPTVTLVIVSIIAALVIWSILHDTFVRPFILVGVLRTYMEAGIAAPPKQESFSELQQLSPKFGKAMAKAGM